MYFLIIVLNILLFKSMSLAMDQDNKDNNNFQLSEEKRKIDAKKRLNERINYLEQASIARQKAEREIIPKDLISKLAKENSTTNYLSEVTGIPEIQTLIAGYLDSKGYNTHNFGIRGTDALAFSTDGKYIAVPYANKIIICETQSKAQLFNVYLDMSTEISKIIYSPKDQYLAWSNKNIIFIYDISNRRLIQRIPVASRNMCFSHDGLFLAYSHNNLLKIVDFNELIKSKRFEDITDITTILEHKNELREFVFLHNNKNLISVEVAINSNDNSVNIWDISKLIPFRIKQFAVENLSSLTSLPNSNLFVIAELDKIKIWDIDNNKEKKSIKCKSTIKIDYTSSILFSPCGKYLATLFRNSNMRDASLKVFFFYKDLENFCIYNLNEIKSGKMTYSPCSNYLLVGVTMFELRNQGLEVLTKLRSKQNFLNSELNYIDTNNEMDLKHIARMPFDENQKNKATLNVKFKLEENPKCIVCESVNAKLKCRYECNIANYCSRECKNSHWHEHLAMCPNNPDSNKINNADSDGNGDWG